LVADEFIRIHAEAHRAAGSPPFKSGVAKNFREAHLLGNLRDAL
jgi:hypothetical protein